MPNTCPSFAVGACPFSQVADSSWSAFTVAECLRGAPGRADSYGDRVPGDDALRFAERLLALLEATRYSATYKLATLLALMDVVAERTGADGSVPDRISGNEVGRRVIELYWPQTVPYGTARDGQSRILRQAPQHDVPAKLAAWRAAAPTRCRR